ncbi:MAG: NADH-quinone oxidoreductase subunit NuoE [Thermodesulfobacteriota bacterium]
MGDAKEVQRDLKELDSLLGKFSGGRESLIPLLQKVQEHYGYVPPETLEPIARHLRVFPAEVQGVVTFYAQFSLTPKGRNIVRVCRGTACHVRGGRSILRVVEENLGISDGQTREDLRFTLETVACLGTCFLAPVMMVNRDYYGKLVPPQVQSILRQYD